MSTEELEFDDGRKIVVFRESDGVRLCIETDHDGMVSGTSISLDEDQSLWLASVLAEFCDV